MSGKVPKALKRQSDTPAQALGAIITELRLKKGWSTHHVTSRVNCDPSYMSGIEHGKQNPTLEVLQAIADLHGVKLSRLIAMAERLHERGAKNRAAGGAAAAKSGKKTR